jgi:hypothetical protein
LTTNKLIYEPKFRFWALGLVFDPKNIFFLQLYKIPDRWIAFGTNLKIKSFKNKDFFKISNTDDDLNHLAKFVEQKHIAMHQKVQETLIKVENFC